MTFADAKQRFSTRVADYVRYRPGYPPTCLALLGAVCGLERQHVIADIGSGTGLLSQLFLRNGNRVFGVEPNEEMRAAGEAFLDDYAEFQSVPGSAEATTLPADSVDLIAAAQAFHWFNPTAARVEFERILRPGGWVVILWNERLTDTTPFLRAYETLLLRFGTDYHQVKQSYPGPEQMRSFFGSWPFTTYELPNSQEFDFAGLSGRLRSSSYVPTPDEFRFWPMMDELQRIFAAYQQSGGVRIDYRTRIYASQWRRDGSHA